MVSEKSLANLKPFQKGTSGNGKGRVKHPVSLKVLLNEHLLQPVDWSIIELMAGKDMAEALKTHFGVEVVDGVDGIVSPEVTYGSALAAKAAFHGFKTEHSQSLVFDRTDGKPTQAIIAEVQHTMEVIPAEGVVKVPLDPSVFEVTPGQIIDLTSVGSDILLDPSEEDSGS